MLGLWGTSVAVAELGPVLVLPEPPGPPPKPPAGFDGEIVVLPDDLAETGTARIPLGTVELGELTPGVGVPWVREETTIAIYSPFGYFPRYRLTARSLTPAGGPVGAFTTADIGMGITDPVGRAPRINPDYDYDPSTVAKNADDEPLFVGTVQSLGPFIPGTEILRMRGFYWGSWNYFTLIFAVGPQYFTPGPSQVVQLELELILL